jgi:uncharacterized damage-inducible protein DinB
LAAFYFPIFVKTTAMHPDIAKLVRAPYYDNYLKKLESADIHAELALSADQLLQTIDSLTNEQWDFAYAEGKWTVKQLLMHLVDTELVFNYRALRIGREQQAQSLEGFDENVYASAVQTKLMTGSELRQLFQNQREMTKLLVRSFSNEQLNRIGKANGWSVQARAIFLITAGHTVHHTQVLKERYLN